MQGLRLALFDLDRTLLDGDSDLLWSEVLGARGVLDVERVRAFHREYHAGTLDIDAFLAFQLAPLAREDRGRLDAWRTEWLQHRVLPRIPSAARQLVADHAARGHEVALITATNAWLTAPIAAELAIPHLIATEPERSAGRFTGRVQGVPCFRAGKITRLVQWLADRGLAWSDVVESWFYSDSHNDLPLLEHVRHPVAVNADPLLAAHARRRGWRLLELRAQPVGAARGTSQASA
ncbi:MAG: HAD family phosphatase [Planctomycetes bacterium]|nr:HAD family phosphatase [Planctomycetota bacterium]